MQERDRKISEVTLGVVVIGRNEGERLVACLDSLESVGAPVVYVDSGSTDRSIEMARSRGATVVELPMDRPFTAGRARNAGFQRLTDLHTRLEYVQFIDGDCRMAEGWGGFATNYLRHTTDVAIVCGRRKEIFPEQSIYNKLCDAEWDTPIGPAEACGGDFLIRSRVFQEIRGFNESLIAGEDPELCHRVRQAGWKIYRADRAMTFHDAAMTRFGQWLRRSSRSGYAYAARAAIHWREPGGYCRRENFRIAFWAAILPLAIMVATIGSSWFLLLLAAYPIQYLRTLGRVSKTDADLPAARYAFFLMLGKWPEFYGQLLFVTRLLRGQTETLIEYK